MHCFGSVLNPLFECKPFCCFAPWRSAFRLHLWRVAKGVYRTFASNAKFLNAESVEHIVFMSSTPPRFSSRSTAVVSRWLSRTSVSSRPFFAGRSRRKAAGVQKRLLLAIRQLSRVLGARAQHARQGRRRRLCALVSSRRWFRAARLPRRRGTLRYDRVVACPTIIGEHGEIHPWRPF